MHVLPQFGVHSLMCIQFGGEFPSEGYVGLQRIFFIIQLLLQRILRGKT